MTNQQTGTLKSRWTALAKLHLAGRRIVAVRWMTASEQEALGWENAAIVMELDNGTLIWPSADDEGNDAGALFGISRSGEELDFPVIG
jgi:hypothetical protein